MLDQLENPRSAATGPRSFIEVTEVWTPDAETGRLTLASGIYGDLHDFKAASDDESFAEGEGLPGKAWAEARPVVLNGFRGSYFKRTAAAEAAGLTTAVAIPVFAGSILKGVLVFLCADDDERVGAIEIWHEGSEQSGVMRLADGYYGAAKHFEWVSHRTQFPRGQGLPGGVWAAGAAMLMRDLGNSYRFIRAESAGAAGLTTGLGLPVEVPDKELLVLTLLSARGTPIARRFELWNAVGGAGTDSQDMILVDGLCEHEGALWDTPKRANVWQGPIGQVAATGVPLARAGADAPGLPAGYSAVVAMPVHRGGRLTQIAAWYF